MALKLTEAQKEEVSQCLLGTSQSVYDVIEQFDYLRTAPQDDAVDAINEAAAEKEVEECEVCGWWCESGEMNEGRCHDCESVEPGDEDGDGG